MTSAQTVSDPIPAASLPLPRWGLVSYVSGRGPARAGVLDADGTVRELPGQLATSSMLELLGRWDHVVDDLLALDLESLSPVDNARLDIPVRFPPKLICAGANYYAHAAEMGTPVPEGIAPYFFMKPPSTTLVGDGDPIPIDDDQVRIDWEAELGVVVGRRVRRLSPSEAADAIAGYVVLNDITDRSGLRREPPVLGPPFAFDWLSAKGLDASCPIGPTLVPAGLIDDPRDLRVRLWVNGELQQDGSTADMVADVPELLVALSHVMTLEPGDIVATGTPAGVGVARGTFLKPGDVVSAEVELVGRVTNQVVRVGEHLEI